MAVLDTNNKGAVVARISMTTETIITLYVSTRSGASSNHRVGVEVSPDGGTTWVEMPHSVLGVGCTSFSCVATDVQAKVFEAEGSASSSNVFLLAR